MAVLIMTMTIERSPTSTNGFGRRIRERYLDRIFFSLNMISGLWLSMPIVNETLLTWMKCS
jgi:hypothetical protein